jgi:hypothetical protein
VFGVGDKDPQAPGHIHLPYDFSGYPVYSTDHKI